MLVVCLYARAVLPDACGPAGVERECERAKLLLECRQAPSLETGPANAEPGGRTGSADGLPAALDEREASANATWGSMRSDQFVRRLLHWFPLSRRLLLAKRVKGLLQRLHAGEPQD